MKKVIVVFLSLIVLVTGVYWFFKPKPVKDLYAPGKYCAFCDTKVLDTHKFYEDDLVIGMCTYRPLSPGHCLVIPKRHVQRYEQLSDEEMARISQVLKKVNLVATQMYSNPSYLIYQKNGQHAGQSVPHVHFHYLPRQESDASVITFFYQTVKANILPPLTAEEMQPTRDLMHDGIANQTLD